MAAAGAGVWLDLGQPEGDIGRSGRAQPNPPAQIGFIDSSIYGLFNVCWNAQDLATCGREEFAADVLVGLGPSVKSGRGERVPPPLRNGRPKFVPQEISLYPLSRGTVLCHCTVCSVRLGRQSIGHTSISHKTHRRRNHSDPASQLIPIGIFLLRPASKNENPSSSKTLFCQSW